MTSSLDCRVFVFITKGNLNAVKFLYTKVIHIFFFASQMHRQMVWGESMLPRTSRRVNNCHSRRPDKPTYINATYFLLLFAVNITSDTYTFIQRVKNAGRIIITFTAVVTHFFFTKYEENMIFFLNKTRIKQTNAICRKINLSQFKKKKKHLNKFDPKILSLRSEINNFSFEDETVKLL